MKINIFNKQKKFEEEVLSGEYAALGIWNIPVIIKTVSND